MLAPDLPDHARLWIFTADAPLPPAQRSAVLERTQDFLARWASHGRPVPADAGFLHDRFLAVAAHLEGGVSGCGIDSLVHAVEGIARGLGFGWLDGLHVAYRDAAGDVQAVPRAAFRALVRDGAVTAETPVFLTTTETLGALRAGGFERPAGTAWHGRVFGLVASAPA
jgi:hypothetical protein